MLCHVNITSTRQLLSDIVWLFKFIWGRCFDKSQMTFFKYILYCEVNFQNLFCIIQNIHIAWHPDTPKIVGSK